MTTNHSTEKCQECGHNSFRTFRDVIYGDNRCFHCRKVVKIPKDDNRLLKENKKNK